MAEGLLDGAFTLNSEHVFNARLYGTAALWKAARALRGMKSGGFKFAGLFNDILWNQYIDRVADSVVINNTQLFGRAFLKGHVKAGIRPCFYIDGTLTEYFFGYGVVEELTIGSDVVRAAIELAEAGTVLVVAKDSLRESSSEYAQGGIAVALSDDDEVELHEQDTLYAGDGLCDRLAVRTLVEEGPAAIQELSV